MQAVQKLSFTEEPNYAQLKGYLTNLMAGVDEYLEKIKKDLFTLVYKQHLDEKMREVTNVAAMKQRRLLEETKNAQLYSSLRKKTEKALIKARTDAILQYTLKEAQKKRNEFI